MTNTITSPCMGYLDNVRVYFKQWTKFNATCSLLVIDRQIVGYTGLNIGPKRNLAYSLAAHVALKSFWCCPSRAVIVAPTVARVALNPSFTGTTFAVKFTTYYTLGVTFIRLLFSCFLFVCNISFPPTWLVLGGWTFILRFIFFLWFSLSHRCLLHRAVIR